MRVLVTGAAGFLGSHLGERLCARGDDVVGLDNFDPFYPRAAKERNLAALRAGGGPGRFTLVDGDLLDPAALGRALEAARAGVVVHLAALAGVRPSLADPERYHRVNAAGTLALLLACRDRGVPEVVLASSSSVYGLGAAVPFREDLPWGEPASPYAASKRALEHHAEVASRLWGMGTTCLRIFTAYGPRQRPDLAIRKFATLIEAGQPIPVFGDGTTERDYTYADDVVAGMVAAVDRQTGPGRGTRRIYNLGGGQSTTLGRLVEALGQALGREPIVDRRSLQTGDLPFTLADTSLAARELGWQPAIRLDDGLRRFVAWLRAEPP